MRLLLQAPEVNSGVVGPLPNWMGSPARLKASSGVLAGREPLPPLAGPVWNDSIVWCKRPGG